MSEAYFYHTISQPTVAEFKDRGSRFIAHAFPLKTIEDFKKILQQLKKEHPKAVHHCFAYRIGTDGNCFRTSDAGEPSGTAGKPILGQIDSKQLTNILIIVVRYFGGTLLGVPGLIHAYKTAASLVLQITPVVRKPIEVKYNLQFDYTQLQQVMLLIKQLDCSIQHQEMQLFCQMTVGIVKNKEDEALYRLKELQQVTAMKVE